MEILIAHPDAVVCASIVRELGDRYELVVAHTAEEALRYIQRSTPLLAVVVGHELDTGPDGVALLDIVAHRMPGVPRVLISKESRTGGAARARRTRVAHRIVPTPWRFGAVATAIDALRLRMQMRRFHRISTHEPEPREDDESAELTHGMLGADTLSA
jgi:hypothetical protein